MKTNDRQTISDLTLEQYHLGELDPAGRMQVESIAASDAAIAARLAALVSSDTELRAGSLIQRLIPTVDRRPVRGSHWQWSVMTAAAVAIVAAVVWLPGVRENAAVSGKPDAAVTERVKGEAAALVLYRKTDAGSELLDDGAPVRTGDLIRVAYRTGAPCFGVIVSIDGAGVVTRHLPIDAPVATAMKSGDATPLDTAYELDNAPKWERFFLVTSERGFDVDAVLEAAYRIATTTGSEPPATLPLPPGFQQSSFLLRKVF